MNKSAMLLCLTILSTALFIVALHLPLEYLPINTRYDKFYHCLFFVILTVLLLSSIQRHWSVGLLIALCIATLSELSQLLSPGRSANLADWYSDLTGIVIAGVLVILVRQLRKLARSLP